MNLVVTHGDDVLCINGCFVMEHDRSRHWPGPERLVFTSFVKANRVARRYRGCYVAEWPPAGNVAVTLLDLLETA